MTFELELSFQNLPAIKNRSGTDAEQEEIHRKFFMASAWVVWCAAAISEDHPEALKACGAELTAFYEKLVDKILEKSNAQTSSPDQ